MDRTASLRDQDSDIAITGLAVITPLGDSLALLAEALDAGRRSLAPAPEPELAGVLESRIADFDATRYANVRGMRIYNRTTRLGISAAKLALGDAGIAGPEVPSDQLGLIMASTFGHLDTLMEYDRSLVSDGIQRTNPALMPLGLPSSPGAAIALSFAAKAFSITLANDAVSALDALALGGRLLQQGRARVCVVVGAFAPFLELSLAARRAGVLATSGDFRVFDRRHCGMAYGEAAAAVVLERRQDARERGAPPRGFIRGQASTFAAEPASLDSALQRASAGALRAAGLTPAHIDVVSAGAQGSPTRDDAEARALCATLGSSASRTPVMAIKANLGETMDAGGLLQALTALSALRTGQLPPLAALDEPAVVGLRYPRGSSATPFGPSAPSLAHGGPGTHGGGHALVTSISSTGACSALILSATDGS